MDRHWIMLANASRARICRFDKGASGLTELADFVHPQSRQKGVELATDRVGHVEKDLGSTARGSSQWAPRTDPRDKAQEGFARELATHMDHAVADQRCQSWVLLASNPFLGELKAHLGKAATAALRASVPMDLTALQGPALRQRLEQVLGERS